MPIVNDVGISDCTSLKQENFRGLLKISIGVVKGIHTRYNLSEPYYYFDLNAGPGKYSSFIGSPLIFIEEAISAGIKHKAMFFEKNEGNYDNLVRAVGKNTNIICLNQDHSEIANFPGLTKQFYGIIYSDENGTCPPWALLKAFFRNKNHQKVDCLIYLSATNIKRIRRSDSRRESLVDGMNDVGKKFWLVRKPEDKHQWTFAIGTNWANFPAWEKRGFYRVGSAIGGSILSRLQHTTEELKKIHESRQNQFQFSV